MLLFFLKKWFNHIAMVPVRQDSCATEPDYTETSMQIYFSKKRAKNHVFETAAYQGNIYL